MAIIDKHSTHLVKRVVRGSLLGNNEREDTELTGGGCPDA
jgi:hypothetical protein